MWSVRTAPDARIPSTAHPAKSGEKYCTTLIFLISLIYLSYRFLPFAIISSVGRMYMRACKKTRGAWWGWRGGWEQYRDIYNSTVTFLRFYRCRRLCCTPARYLIIIWDAFGLTDLFLFYFIPCILRKHVAKCR